MSIEASIIIPTRDRADYLAVALASIAPQAREHAAELLVLDDGSASGAIRAIAERFGARYLAHPEPLGLNAARNSAIAHSSGELIVFVDDDVEVHPGWLAALLRAATEHPEVQIFTGPIHPRLEGHGGWTRHSCGREGPPITALELGPQNTDQVRYAWGANMTVRRRAVEQIGPFDAALGIYGDEQEWQDRLRSHGEGGVLYVAAAALDHRRSPADARLRALARGARFRGAASRRFDAWRGQAPSLARELRTLAGCAGHVVRRRCPAGLTLVAHSLGRVEQALRERRGGPGDVDAETTRQPTPPEDFLSGESGTVGGLDALRRELLDRATETAQLISTRRLRLALAAKQSPPLRRVLVLGIERPQHAAMAEAIRAELQRSRHAAEVHFCQPEGLGKFENLNRLLDAHPAWQHDWLVVIDDDVRLPRGFLDRLLFLAERFELDLAQPAHRARSHAAWRVTRRHAGSVVRETRFVEIGPVSAFARRTFAELLPFPALGMGWGLDLHWGALAQERGWRCGVLDALAIGHTVAPAASFYSRSEAIAEARAFLTERPYIDARAAQQTLAIHRHW